MLQDLNLLLELFFGSQMERGPSVYFSKVSSLSPSFKHIIKHFVLIHMANGRYFREFICWSTFVEGYHIFELYIIKWRLRDNWALCGVFIILVLLCRVRLAAKVGTNFLDSCKDWLETTGIDTSSLVLWPNPTLRTWQFMCIQLTGASSGSVQILEKT
ncbi:hypothetical protein M758_UG190100 [Ceratodon purpureus]|nr:hypothetical protein M758_UG190100 [Ceratodon purpureus]